MRPITFQEFLADEDKRREAWSRVFSGAAGWTGRRPNRGHQAVSALIAAGKAVAVITQNVDNLHQDGGAPEESVIELHGNASYARCLSCGVRHELESFRQAFLERSEIPTCRACSGLVKTATISFGQAMPQEAMRRARTASLSCDLFVVLGSSLTVEPASSFPVLAKRRGAVLAIVNREPTGLDTLADLTLHEEIGDVMSEVVPLALGRPL
jgi:NAD-dependent deacetylase